MRVCARICPYMPVNSRVCLAILSIGYFIRQSLSPVIAPFTALFWRGVTIGKAVKNIFPCSLIRKHAAPPFLTAPPLR